MTLSFIRCFFLIISTAVGYYIGIINENILLGAQIGCLSGLVVIFLESRMKRVSVRGLSSMVFGLLLGIFMSKLIADIISLLPVGDFIISVSRVILTLIFSYLGAVMALRGKDEFNIIIPYVRFRRQEANEGVILLDTSTIIDGRIGNIYKTRFVPGQLVVPKFILHELQSLADSSDDLKRKKGRRGLEILKDLQADKNIDIKMHDEEIIENMPVDAKLVHLAKIVDARICTTDFNLSHVASLQGVGVLNIHDLSNAVRINVSSGDELEIDLVKVGKENNQAVGYLEDGTMVVVSDAANCVGQRRKVSITSVLNTQAGKMIFSRLN